MLLALSLSLITLFAASVEPFKISKGQQQQPQPQPLAQQLDGQQFPGELGPYQAQGPQFSTYQWTGERVRGQREQEYYGQDYYGQRPLGPYYRESAARPTISYDRGEEYTRGETATKGSGAYLDRERDYGLYQQQQPIVTRQPQYAPTAYGTQQLALVLIRPLQLSPAQQQSYPSSEQLPSYANLLLQAGPDSAHIQRPEPLPLPLPSAGELQPAQFGQQQQQQVGLYGSTGGDKLGGVFAKGHEKLSKLKSHFERFAADAKAKLSLGSTYHYNGEETLPGPGQPFIAGPIGQPGGRPQLVGRPAPVQHQQVQAQQQLLQGQLELGDIQLSKQEQEKIRDNQHQEKLEQQQQELPDQDKATKQQQDSLAQPDRLPLAIKQQVAVEQPTVAKAAADANEGFGRREFGHSKTL